MTELVYFMFILVGYLNLTNCNRKKVFHKKFFKYAASTFPFPVAVSYGRRNKEFWPAAKKGSYHAQTSVASTMETVQSTCFVHLQKLISMLVHIAPENS